MCTWGLDLNHAINILLTVAKKKKRNNNEQSKQGV
jgi:hypothetical protein